MVSLKFWSHKQGVHCYRTVSQTSWSRCCTHFTRVNYYFDQFRIWGHIVHACKACWFLWLVHQATILTYSRKVFAVLNQSSMIFWIFAAILKLKVQSTQKRHDKVFLQFFWKELMAAMYNLLLSLQHYIRNVEMPKTWHRRVQ
jgi:hypothetical protein